MKTSLPLISYHYVGGNSGRYVGGNSAALWYLRMACKDHFVFLNHNNATKNASLGGILEINLKTKCAFGHRKMFRGAPA